MTHNQLFSLLLVTLAIGGAACEGDAPSPPLDPAPKAPPLPVPLSPALEPDSRLALHRWYTEAQNPKPDESFGEFIARTATQQLGIPYFNQPQSAKPERFSISLNTFQCVSLVETSMALARCIWRKERSEGCFVDEVQQSRYRDGEVDGYASRLHYFFDWLTNNSERGRLIPLTKALGGKKFWPRRKRKLFSIMTNRPKRYPALLNPAVFEDIQSIEDSLNEIQPFVLNGKQLRKLNHKLKDGDVIAVVTSVKGILVSHTGFVLKTPDGKARLLHASSYHKRVVLSEGDIANYINSDPKRLGVLVYRPEHPDA